MGQIYVKILTISILLSQDNMPVDMILMWKNSVTNFFNIKLISNFSTLSTQANYLSNFTNADLNSLTAQIHIFQQNVLKAYYKFHISSLKSSKNNQIALNPE